MLCKDCVHYKPSEMMAGGRCKHLPNNARFIDDTCSAFGKKNGVTTFLFEGKEAAKPMDDEEIWS